MLARIFLGTIMIIAFLMIFPMISGIWTDNDSGLNSLMANMTNYDGSPALSDMETTYWGLFPLLFFLIGVGGLIWLIARDR